MMDPSIELQNHKELKKKGRKGHLATSSTLSQDET